MGLKLRIEVANSVDELIRKLLAGEGDMIAYNLPITKEWKDSIPLLRGRYHYSSSDCATGKKQVSERCNRAGRKRHIC